LYSVLSFSRETIDIKNAARRLLLDPLDTYSGAVVYDFTDYLTGITNFFFQNFQKGRGFRDRYDYRIQFQYRLPFLKTIELAYEFGRKNHPNEVLNTGSIRYSNRFFKERLTTDLSYVMSAKNASEDFGVTYTNSFRIFNSIKVKEWLYVNSDVTLAFEGGYDRDTFQTYRTYLTMILDKELMFGKPSGLKSTSKVEKN